MIGDLFEVDKRLALKPVVELNNYLRQAFADGPCTCLRCKESGGDESGYEHRHTFVFAGRQVSRRFACTAASDVLAALKKAWLSYTKAELSVSGNLDLAAVEAFVDSELHERLRALLLASSLVKEVDGQWQLQAQAAA